MSEDYLNTLNNIANGGKTVANSSAPRTTERQSADPGTLKDATRVPEPPRPDVAPHRAGGGHVPHHPPKYDSGGEGYYGPSAWAYAALGLGHAGMALFNLFTPSKVPDFGINQLVLSSVKQQVIKQNVGVGFLATATASFGLVAAYGSCSDTADRLNVGMMAVGASGLAILARNPGLFDLEEGGAYSVLKVGLVAASLVVPAAVSLWTPQGRWRVWWRIKGLFGAAGSLFSFPKGPTVSSLLYSAATAGLVVTGLAHLIAPEGTLSGLIGDSLQGWGVEGMSQVIGKDILFVLPAITYSLKVKSDENDLQSPVARYLNWGLLATSIANLSVNGPLLYRGEGGNLLPEIIALWTTSALGAAIGLFSEGSG